MYPETHSESFMQPLLGSFLQICIGPGMRKNTVELEKVWRVATGMFRGEGQCLYKKRLVRQGVSSLESGEWQCHMNSMEKARYKQLFMIFQCENKGHLTK